MSNHHPSRTLREPVDFPLKDVEGGESSFGVTGAAQQGAKAGERSVPRGQESHVFRDGGRRVEGDEAG